MISKKDRIQKRIEAIRDNISRIEGIRAFLTLGSAGAQDVRLDDYSDIDFFLIVASGYKMRFIENLDWLCDISEPGFYFANTKDGYKFLYADGMHQTLTCHCANPLSNIRRGFHQIWNGLSMKR